MIFIVLFKQLACNVDAYKIMYVTYMLIIMHNNKKSIHKHATHPMTRTLTIPSNQPM